jgi:hypothetical protein
MLRAHQNRRGFDLIGGKNGGARRVFARQQQRDVIAHGFDAAARASGDEALRRRHTAIGKPLNFDRHGPILCDGQISSHPRCAQI